ncbi:FKBP-type peptidyl-prolyl cis-trans isomerase [Diaminobutyricibacter sp. McL0608]|uniref:FKBP-type peptidyl-prolyl cis-trans isomerase n=1 Tax=Leifsonia sp. McL0608 TaxID=3143537 RepID=UPI0031F2E578
MRKTLSLIAAVGAILALAACSSGAPAPTSTSTSAASAKCVSTPSGATSKAVSVTGDFRATPTVKFSAPLKATSTERTVVIKGKGSDVKPSSTVDIALAAYNGTTGKLLSASGFDKTSPVPIVVDDTQYVPGLVRTIECVPVGSRVVTTSTVKDSFGSQDTSSLGLKATDTVVFVADVVDLVPTRANGTPVAPTAGFPTVKLSSIGQPTITIPKTAPPTTTKIAVLKQGDGAVVKSTDTISLQYQGVLWRTGKVFDQSWGRGVYSGAVTGFVAGFTKALEGQKVGSQVIVIIPPADGYGTKGKGDIKGTDTMVFVIDIVKTTH